MSLKGSYATKTTRGQERKKGTRKPKSQVVLFGKQFGPQTDCVKFPLSRSTHLAVAAGRIFPSVRCITRSSNLFQ